MNEFKPTRIWLIETDSPADFKIIEGRMGKDRTYNVRELVDAIPVEYIRKQMERYDKEAHKYSEENKSMLAICEIDKYNALKHILDDWQKESGEWEEYIKGTL